MVDGGFGPRRGVVEVRVFNRLDYCAMRARSQEIFLSSDGEEWRRVYSNDDKNIGGADGRPLTFVAAPDTHARFVKLQLASRNCLHLDEIEVWGPS